MFALSNLARFVAAARNSKNPAHLLEIHVEVRVCVRHRCPDSVFGAEWVVPTVGRFGRASCKKQLEAHTLNITITIAIADTEFFLCNCFSWKRLQLFCELLLLFVVR